MSRCSTADISQRQRRFPQQLRSSTYQESDRPGARWFRYERPQSEAQLAEFALWPRRVNATRRVRRRSAEAR